MHDARQSPEPATAVRGRWHSGWLALLSVALLFPGSAQPFTSDLETVWLDTDPVPRGECRQFLVKAWPERLYRGRRSPHDCLVNAIRDYRLGDHEEAMGWLQAAVCPDREAQQRLLRQAPAVFQYLLSVFGPHVP